jgi:hypothetical protein
MTKAGKILLYIIAIIVIGLVCWRIVKGATVGLTWTSPYDPRPGGKGVRVSGYELKFSTDSAGFAANPSIGATFASMPVPLDSGLLATVNVTGLSDFQRYYFAIRSVDAVGNWSGWSNIAAKTTPDLTGPSTVIDLR